MWKSCQLVCDLAPEPKPFDRFNSNSKDRHSMEAVTEFLLLAILAHNLCFHKIINRHYHITHFEDIDDFHQNDFQFSCIMNNNKACLP
jgi:hypothetical protein